MTYEEINMLMGQLFQAQSDLEEAYENNGGEVNEDTENIEAEIEAVKEILANDGVDELGRKVLSFQHKIEDLKAERDHINAIIKSYERNIDRAKFIAGRALRMLGMDKVKGKNGYSFSQYTSETTKADDAAIKEMYLESAQEVLRHAGFPAWITCKLSASSSLVPEGTELPSYFIKTVTETSKFGKPVKRNE